MTKPLERDPFPPVPIACQRTHPDGLAELPPHYLELDEEKKALVELDIKLADAESKGLVLQDLRDCQRWIDELRRAQARDR